MKTKLDLNAMGVKELSINDKNQTNSGGIFYWIGYAMGVLADENQKLATENSEYSAMTHSFGH